MGRSYTAMELYKSHQPLGSRLAFLVCIFPHLVSCFQIISEISTFVIFIQNETLKFRLLFINFVSFSDYIVAIKEVNLKKTKLIPDLNHTTLHQQTYFFP